MLPGILLGKHEKNGFPLVGFNSILFKGFLLYQELRIKKVPLLKQRKMKYSQFFRKQGKRCYRGFSKCPRNPEEGAIKFSFKRTEKPSLRAF